MRPIGGGRRTRWAACCAVLLLAAACRGGGGRAGGAGAGGRTGRLLWTVELGVGSLEGPAVGADGTVYAAGSVPATEDDLGRPLAPGRRRFALMAVDGTGHVVRTLPGTLIGGGYSNTQMWVRLSSWGTAYAVDTQGGLYGMFADGTQQYRNVSGSLSGPPAIADNGRLFVAANRATVGYDLQATGDPAAVRFEQGSWGKAPAVGPDGLLYLGTRYGLAAVDAGGETRWLFRGGPVTAVLDDQGLAYFSDKNRLVALDASGSERWHYEAPDPLTDPVFSPEKAMVVIGQSGLVHAIGLDGERRWRFPLASLPVAGAGVGPDGTVYACDRTGLLTAIGPGGTARWTMKFDFAVGRPAVGPDGTVYVQNSYGVLRAVSPP